MNPSPLAALTAVTQADVYKAGALAATLRRLPGANEFVYRPEYLAIGGRPIATTLPLSEAPVRTAAGAVPAYFAGLLPEGRRLSALRRALKTSADDELSLLLAVGLDTIGDVQIAPAGQSVASIPPMVTVQREWSEVRFGDVLADAGMVDPVGLPGVQDKASARMISVPLRRAGERFLLKLDPPEFAHVVENEAFFLQLAREVRMPSAHATVVRDRDGRPGLLVRRFDRIPQSDGSTLALACEDGCQVLGRWPADKYLASYEEVVQALSDQCAARAVASRSLFQQLCFAWLTGNGDVHAKNLAILMTVDGEWRASPAYDLPSTVPYGDTSLALSILGRNSGLSRRHLLDFAAATNLPQKAATKVLDGLLARMGDLEDRLRASGPPFSQRAMADLIAELRHRRRQALG